MAKVIDIKRAFSNGELIQVHFRLDCGHYLFMQYETDVDFCVEKESDHDCLKCLSLDSKKPVDQEIE